MQFAAHRPDPFDEPGFDVHVDILEGDGRSKFTRYKLLKDGIQPGPDLVSIGNTDDLLAAEHFCVSLGTTNIVFGQALFKTDRSGKFFHEFVGWLSEATGPEFLTHVHSSKTGFRYQGSAVKKTEFPRRLPRVVHCP